jgi:hypothetical protein
LRVLVSFGKIPTVPFTISHIAAVLPLRQTRLIFSGLVIGSIAPDLPHVLFSPGLARYAHSQMGLVTVSLPLGLATFLVVQFLVRRPLLALAPDRVRLRLPADNAISLRSGVKLLWILISISVGIISHILWDSFTHSNGLLVLNWALLREATPFWPHRPIYKFLQPFFSILGLAALWVSIWSWIRRTPPSDSQVVPPIGSETTRFRVIVYGTSGVITTACCYSFFYLHTHPGGFWMILAIFLFACMPPTILLILSFSAWWYFRKQ